MPDAIEQDHVTLTVQVRGHTHTIRLPIMTDEVSGYIMASQTIGGAFADMVTTGYDFLSAGGPEVI
jgi:hypothetical protein